MNKVRVWCTLSSDNEQSEGVAYTDIRQWTKWGCGIHCHHTMNKVRVWCTLSSDDEQSVGVAYTVIIQWTKRGCGVHCHQTMNKVRVWRTLSSDNEQSEGVVCTVIRWWTKWGCGVHCHQTMNKVRVWRTLSSDNVIRQSIRWWTKWCWGLHWTHRIRWWRVSRTLHTVYPSLIVASQNALLRVCNMSGLKSQDYSNTPILLCIISDHRYHLKKDDDASLILAGQHSCYMFSPLTHCWRLIFCCGVPGNADLHPHFHCALPGPKASSPPEISIRHQTHCPITLSDSEPHWTAPFTIPTHNALFCPRDWVMVLVNRPLYHPNPQCFVLP